MAVLSEAPHSWMLLLRSGIQELTAGKTLSTLRERRHSHRHRLAAAWPILVRQSGPVFRRHRHAGRRRDLPNRRAHELFEERARVHPDAIAAVHGNRQLTYRELNARANRLARAVLARGLSREGVVGVVTERNLEWMTAVLAIFKAGGAYLPVEPHFPADHIARTLARAGCRLVLTEHGSTATLDRALDSLTGVQKVFIDAACEEGHPDGDLEIDVASDQLAYIYFTSGSTGEPKGAMCEQVGMLNHLFAKIDDLGIGERDVVAPRRRLSASTSRCGNWFPRFWSAGGL